MCIVNRAYFADVFGVCCMCSDVKFAARDPLHRGRDTQDSQHGVGSNAVASTLTRLVLTDCCHGMKC